MKANPAKLSERNSLQATMVFFIAILVTVGFWTALPTAYRGEESTDYLTSYEPVARNILAGHGLTTKAGKPAIDRPPLFSLMLVAVFGIAQTVVIPEPVMLQAFLLFWIGLAAGLLFAIARQVCSPPLAFMVAGLWIIYPPALWMGKQMNSEVPFTAILFASAWVFWLAWKHRRYQMWLFLAVGVLIGLAALIRPIAIGLAIPFCILLAFQTDQKIRTRLFASLLILLGFAATILPWEIWVYEKSGQIILLSKTDVPSVLDGLGFAVETKGYRSTVWVPQDVQEWMLAIQDAVLARRPTSLPEVGAIILPLAKQQPLSFAKFLLFKAARAWYGTDSQRLDGLVLAVQLPFIAAILWGTMVAWKAGGFSRIFSIGTWLTVLYFWAMTILVLPILRYMTPAIGLLFCLIPASLGWAASRRYPNHPILSTEESTRLK